MTWQGGVLGTLERTGVLVGPGLAGVVSAEFGVGCWSTSFYSPELASFMRATHSQAKELQQQKTAKS